MCPVHNPITSSIRKPNHAETKSRNDEEKKRLKRESNLKLLALTLAALGSLLGEEVCFEMLDAF
jgi:hypothetical protein